MSLTNIESDFLGNWVYNVLSAHLCHCLMLLKMLLGPEEINENTMLQSPLQHMRGRKILDSHFTNFDRNKYQHQ